MSLLKFLFLLLFSLQSLYAFKDTFYLGLSQGSVKSSGVNSRLEGSTGTNYKDITGSSSGLKFGPDFNLDRAHQLHLRWEMFLDRRNYNYHSGSAYESLDAWHAGVAAVIGHNIDILLNDDIVPFIKIGYAINDGEKLGQGSEAILGLGLLYMTKHFEIGVGVDYEGKAWEGLTINTNYYYDSRETAYNSYLMINYRF